MTRGRKQIEIDKNQFENLCKLQCTLEEIAGWFNCSEDTIERWCKREYKEKFADIYKKASSGGRISLRRSQFRMAETNATMAIWLGKQYLGQSDKGKLQITTSNTKDFVKEKTAEELKAILGEIDDDEDED